jgi:hypothetical protein
LELKKNIVKRQLSRYFRQTRTNYPDNKYEGKLCVDLQIIMSQPTSAHLAQIAQAGRTTGAVTRAVPAATTERGAEPAEASAASGASGRGGSGGVAGGVTLQRGDFDGARSRTMPSSS